MRPTLPAAAVLLSCLVAGCGKKGPDPAPAPAPAPAADAAPLPAAASPTDANVPAPAELAKAYAAIRCVLLGGALPGDDLYRKHGFVTAGAFAEAFAFRAKREPAWARATIAAAYAQPCGNARPVPTDPPPGAEPTAVTPTSPSP